MKVVKGALAAGVVLWIWSVVYWVFSGVPVKGMTEFKDAAAVEAVLKANTKGPGFYVIPSAWVPDDVEDQNKWMEERGAKIASGFFSAGAVAPRGVGGFGGQIGRSVLGNFVSAALVSWLLLQTAGLGFGGRVLFVQVCALSAWVIASWPLHVWWGYPTGFTLLLLVDYMVGWTLAGLVLAKLLAPEPAAG